MIKSTNPYNSTATIFNSSNGNKNDDKSNLVIKIVQIDSAVDDIRGILDKGLAQKYFKQMNRSASNPMTQRKQN